MSEYKVLRVQNSAAMVAQWAAHPTGNLGVPGSAPTGGGISFVPQCVSVSFPQKVSENVQLSQAVLELELTHHSVVCSFDIFVLFHHKISVIKLFSEWI